jgi:hypothetical protein
LGYNKRFDFSKKSSGRVEQGRNKTPPGTFMPRNLRDLTGRNKTPPAPFAPPFSREPFLFYNASRVLPTVRRMMAPCFAHREANDEARA